ncbi:MAG TPA: hypothetical protein VLU92_05710 [Candidatus Dormibacteraeota bacterium]|nr:hypothetical protein [Candidatus Dormibacteraeota bacterium]
MTKPMITKTWIAGLVVLAAGLVVAVVGVALMLAYGGTFTQVGGTNGSYTFVPTLDSFFWSTVVLIVVGAVLATIGGIVQLAAWIGALVNSYRLPDKTWFTVLLLGGVFGLAFGLIGFAVMVAYVVAAPDGQLYSRPEAQLEAQRPPTLAPTS